MYDDQLACMYASVRKFVRGVNYMYNIVISFVDIARVKNTSKSCWAYICLPRYQYLYCFYCIDDIIP
jgi:hypothetical protein